MTRARTGLLVIRAWVEPGSSSPLRFEIRLTTDVSVGFERTLHFAQDDAAVKAVQAWLSEMAVGARSDPDGA